MTTFTMKYQGRKHKMALVSLHPVQPSNGSDNTAYFMSIAAYARDPAGRMEYQGVSARGQVRIDELVRWAVRKGFLQWEVDEDFPTQTQTKGASR